MYTRDGGFRCVLLWLRCRRQGRKEAFEQRKRELKALGLGQDGRPINKEDDKKDVKSRGKVCMSVSMSILAAVARPQTKSGTQLRET